jgi:hypothetical protein
MRQRARIVTAGVIISTLYALVIFYTPERLCSDWARDDKGIRFLADDFDRSAYFVRGMWYVFGLRQMSQLDAEYPPLTIYFFALPFVIADIAGKDLVSSLDKPLPEVLVNSLQSQGRRLYTNLFTVLMVPLYVALLYVTLLKRERGKEEFKLSDGEGYVILFFLPAFLYFSLNRFDVLPSLMVSLAVLALLSDKSSLISGALLGAGMMTKWYPALLAPAFFKYYFGKSPATAVRFAISFACVVMVSLLPLLVFGEWKAFLNPYSFQLGRGGDVLSFFGLLAHWQGKELSRWAQIVLLVFQLSPSLLALTARLRTKRAVLEWSLVSLFSFLFFAKFYSPQWLIWVVPFLVVKMNSRRLFFLVVLWDLSSYLIFPLLYDVYGIHDHSPPFLYSLCVLVKTVLIFILAFSSGRLALSDLREGWRA